MGNIFRKYKSKQYKSDLMNPLNDPYASIDQYHNDTIMNIIQRIEDLEKKYQSIEDNLFVLEENATQNFKLISEDLYHINDKLENNKKNEINETNY